jgi:hypothetical protein
MRETESYQNAKSPTQVIGQITYSKRHGFLERNEDVDGMIGYLGKLFGYVAPVSLWSFLLTKLVAYK